MNDLDAEEQRLLADNIAWLKEVEPDDWHRAALDYNWSLPLYLLDWIVRQDDCDVATALTIFWLGEPNSWIGEVQERDKILNGFSDLNQSICAYVALRVAAGGYTRSKIAFAPDAFMKQEYVELSTQEKDSAHPSFHAHYNLIRKRRGRTVVNDKDFYERYPERFHCTVLIELPDPSLRATAMMDTIKRIEGKTRGLLPAWLRSQGDDLAALNKSTWDLS